MFSKFKKFVLAFFAALILAGILVPNDIQAQDQPTHIPTISKIQLSEAEAATQNNDCVTTSPIGPPTEAELFAARAPEKLWAPIMYRGEPAQCTEPPAGLNGAVGFLGQAEIVVPTTPIDEDDAEFQSVRGASSADVPFELNPSDITDEEFEEGSKPRNEGEIYNYELEGVWYLGQEPIEESELVNGQATIASIEAIPSPFGDSQSRYRQLSKADKLYAEEGLTSLKLNELSRLYTGPGENYPNATLGEICPESDLSNYLVVYQGSFGSPDLIIGPAAKFNIWTRIRHQVFQIEDCPQVASFRVLDADSAWAGFSTTQKEEVQREVDKDSWIVNNLLLFPNPPGMDNPFLEPARIMALNPEDELVWVGITVTVAIGTGVVALKFIAAMRGIPVTP